MAGAKIEILKGVRLDGKLYSPGNVQDAKELQGKLKKAQKERLVAAGAIGPARQEMDMTDVGEDDGDEESDDDADQPLPNGFPMKMRLDAAGFNTLGKLRAASDEELMALDGIGASRVEEIRSFLNV